MTEIHVKCKLKSQKNCEKCPSEFPKSQSDIFKLLVLSEPAVQNPSLYFHMSQKSGKPSQLRMWHLRIFAILLRESFKNKLSKVNKTLFTQHISFQAKAAQTVSSQRYEY